MLLNGAEAQRALERLVAHCIQVAEELAADEAGQAHQIEAVISTAREDILAGRLQLTETAELDERVIRLYKGPVAGGRLKLQLFPLDKGDAHPPHAHNNLLSCQILLRGRARIAEFSIIGPEEPGFVHLRSEPIKTLGVGDGVVTLARRNNVHWQEGMLDGTLLLNVNWQGLLPQAAEGQNGPTGRRALDWSGKKATEAAGIYRVPLAPPSVGHSP